MASAAPRGLKVPESCGFPGDTTILWRFHAGFRVPPRKRGGIPRVLRSPRPSQGDTREQSRADFGAGHADQDVEGRRRPGDRGLFDDKGIIAGELKKGAKVQITGFGNFEARKRAARAGRNPKTGGVIQIKASIAPAFRAGKQLKQVVNKK